MAFARIPLPEQATADFKTKCTAWLRRARQQKLLAKLMVKRIHAMRARAAEMTERPKSWIIDAWTSRDDL